MATASSEYAKFERVLNGEATAPEDIPRSAWQHLVGNEFDPGQFIKATIDFQRKWDWDWVKLHPRATYLAEVWGAQFDPDDYLDKLPRYVEPVIKTTDDLAKIQPLDPKDSPVLKELVSDAATVRKEFADRPVIQTLFSPLSILLWLTGLPRFPHGSNAYGANPVITSQQLITENPELAKQALSAIAQTLSAYTQWLLEPTQQGGAGIDGVFYATTGTASEEYYSKAQFDEFSKPYDLEALKGAEHGVTILHTCGAASHPEWFADWPIDILQWDQYLPGNPPLSADFGHTALGGVNRSLFTKGTDPQQVIDQIRATFEEFGDRPFLLSPSCSLPLSDNDDLVKLLKSNKF
ncbi:uroporphyrinogen decarboxylase [Bifidobacterium goeldii]|uniref:Uroporphyrinogen decarboxylase n=1 Tax=Bifidobacterium goeldii TaxID=2306975 RepID=A0A430FNF4_9BIFI|nr:uroporphyrinogen decarboxylase family protein [Bifidobacterium goeldii]RSX54357.1 uroporphyrinogen decarboxylase [Bifidobacterium goeldii]